MTKPKELLHASRVRSTVRWADQRPAGRSKAATSDASIQRLGALIAIAALIFAVPGTAQTAKEGIGATPLVAIPNEAPPKLIVDPPIPEQLAQGRVFIQYRTENLRIMPVYGKAALDVSPRVGHLHYFVDGMSWPILDASGGTISLVGLKPGPHAIRFELADATHRPIPGASQLVEFVIPEQK